MKIKIMLILAFILALVNLPVAQAYDSDTIDTVETMQFLRGNAVEPTPNTLTEVAIATPGQPILIHKIIICGDCPDVRITKDTALRFQISSAHKTAPVAFDDPELIFRYNQYCRGYGSGAVYVGKGEDITENFDPPIYYNQPFIYASIVGYTNDIRKGMTVAIGYTFASGYVPPVEPPPIVEPSSGLGEGVRVYNNISTPIPDSTWTVLTFNSERWDTNSLHSTVSNTSRLTCQIPGKYIIIGQVQFDTDPDGWRNASIRLNGTNTLAIFTSVPGGKPISVFNEVSTVWNLNAGDYVELMAWHNAGGPLNSVYSESTFPEFMMQLISP